MQEHTGNERDWGILQAGVLQGSTLGGFTSVHLSVQFFFYAFRGDNTLRNALVVFRNESLEMIATAKKEIIFLLNLISWPWADIWNSWCCCKAQIFLVGDLKDFSYSRWKCLLWTIKAARLFLTRLVCYATNIINLCGLGSFCSQAQ